MNRNKITKAVVTALVGVLLGGRCWGEWAVIPEENAPAILHSSLDSNVYFEFTEGGGVSLSGLEELFTGQAALDRGHAYDPGSLTFPAGWDGSSYSNPWAVSSSVSDGLLSDISGTFTFGVLGLSVLAIVALVVAIGRRVRKAIISNKGGG